MATKTRPARVIQFAEIEKRFELVPMSFGKVHPAVVRKDDQPDRYSIRVLKSETRSGADTTTKYDYFRCDAEGNITEAPRGYAKDYRPGRIPVEELDAAVERYAAVAR